MTAPVVSLPDLERAAIEHALEVYDNDKKRAAQALGISWKTLYTKIHTYGLAGRYIKKPSMKETTP